MTRAEYQQKYKEWEESVEDKYNAYPEDEAQYYYKRDEVKFLKSVIDQIFDVLEKRKSYPQKTFNHMIYSEMDNVPCMEVTRELHCTLIMENKDPVDYKPEGSNETHKESTNSLNKLIHDYAMIGDIMNRFPDMYRDGVIKLTYDGKTYDMRNKKEVEELRETAIHFIGLPDL
jgi:hypothetical protein